MPPVNSSKRTESNKAPNRLDPNISYPFKGVKKEDKGKSEKK